MRVLAFTALALALPAVAQTPQKIVPAKSEITFVTKQMNVPVDGRFRKFDATVAFDPAKPDATRAEFEVDLASIDLGNAEGETEAKRKLWLDTGAFPKAKFVAAAVKPIGPGQYEASGALTIKGISHPVRAAFTLTETAKERTVIGQFPLKRLQFRVGEAQWSDTDTVADEVLVRFRFVLPR
jgi:polyisoprenoid-binding protein YceI